MRRLPLILTASASLIALAHAQQSVPGHSHSDEEIVVTAPLEGSRIESLQGAEILDKQQIVERLANTLGEVLAGLPGVSSTFYGPGASRPIIRGLGDDRIRILENGIGAIDAASASPDHAVGADPLDARRIEVLRGAAALAYGGNAVGGVVNVIDETIPTRAPDKGWQARGLASYSTADEGLQGGLGLTATAGDFVLNGDFAWREADDYETPLGKALNAFVDSRSYALGASLVKDWGFAGAGWKRFETSYGLPPEAPAEPGGHIELRQDRYEARGDIRIGDGVFRRFDFAFQYSDYTHTEFEGSGEPGTIFNNKGYEGRLELHNKAPDGRLSGATGLQLSQTDFEAIGEEAFLTPTETTDIGLFTVQRWDNDSWGLEGGLRIEHRDLDNDVAGKRDFTPVSVSAGVFARPADNWFAGLTFARTERAPTNAELFADGPHLATAAYEVGDDSLGIETALSAEASLRYASDIYTFELSLYRIGFDGYIALIPTGAEVEIEPGEFLPEFAFIQRDATFTGGEISASARLGQVGGFTFRADAAADLVRAEFDGGGDLPRIPPSTVTLGLAATSDALDARIELVDIAQQTHVAAFESETDGSTVLNARLAWRPAPDHDLTFLLAADNLTDELVQVHSSFLKETRPRPGRNFRLAISAKY
ncbi:MAG: TonB-dependent receptor [Micropepsaceae bacterium]